MEVDSAVVEGSEQVNAALEAAKLSGEPYEIVFRKDPAAAPATATQKDCVGAVDDLQRLWELSAQAVGSPTPNTSLQREIAQAEADLNKQIKEEYKNVERGYPVSRFFKKPLEKLRGATYLPKQDALVTTLRQYRGEHQPGDVLKINDVDITNKSYLDILEVVRIEMKRGQLMVAYVRSATGSVEQHKFNEYRSQISLWETLAPAAVANTSGIRIVFNDPVKGEKQVKQQGPWNQTSIDQVRLLRRRVARQWKVAHSMVRLAITHINDQPLKEGHTTQWRRTPMRDSHIYADYDLDNYGRGKHVTINVDAWQIREKRNFSVHGALETKRNDPLYVAVTDVWDEVYFSIADKFGVSPDSFTVAPKAKRRNGEGAWTRQTPVTRLLPGTNNTVRVRMLWGEEEQWEFQRMASLNLVSRSSPSNVPERIPTGRSALSSFLNLGPSTNTLREQIRDNVRTTDDGNVTPEPPNSVRLPPSTAAGHRRLDSVRLAPSTATHHRVDSMRLAPSRNEPRPENYTDFPALPERLD